MTQFFNCIHSITVEFNNNQFCVYSKSQLPPIYAWAGIGPLSITSKDDVEKLAKNIVIAKVNSKTREQLTQSDEKRMEFTNEENEILKKTTKLWTIDWDENNTAYITSWESFPKTDTITYKGKAWRPIKDSETVFSPTATAKDFAQKLIELV